MRNPRLITLAASALLLTSTTFALADIASPVPKAVSTSSAMSGSMHGGSMSKSKMSHSMMKGHMSGKMTPKPLKTPTTATGTITKPSSH